MQGLTKISLIKMTHRKDTKTGLYRSKMDPNLKRNFALFSVLDWIAEITAHIPNKGEPLVRYYGVSYKDKPKTKGTGDVVAMSRCLIADG